MSKVLHLIEMKYNFLIENSNDQWAHKNYTYIQNGLLKFYDFYLYNPSHFLNVQGKISSSKHDFKNLYYRTVRLFKKICPYN